MPHQATAIARAAESEFVGRLARFFPEATPVRIPIRLSHDAQADAADQGIPQSWSRLPDTVIEFGTPQEVLFAVSRPLEFGDHVLIESRDASLRVEASVVAVQYHRERTVVAARFLKPVPNWIVKS